MSHEELEIEVVDRRKIPHFTLDNLLIDVYGPIIGPDAIAVYAVLARYANRETALCFPSQNTIAHDARMSRPTVRRSLDILAQVGLILVAPRAGSNGARVAHQYALLEVLRLSEAQAASLSALVGQRLKADAETPPVNAAETPPLSTGDTTLVNAGYKGCKGPLQGVVNGVDRNKTNRTRLIEQDPLSAGAPAATPPARVKEPAARTQTKAQQVVTLCNDVNGGALQYSREVPAAQKLLAMSCRPMVEELVAVYTIWYKRRLKEQVVERYGCSLHTFLKVAGPLIGDYRRGLYHVTEDNQTLVHRYRVEAQEREAERAAFPQPPLFSLEGRP